MPRVLTVVRNLFILLVLLLTIATSFSQTPVPGILPENREFTVEGDAQGHRSMDGIVVYALSQSQCWQEDKQVYDFQPDINIRSWMKWQDQGNHASDYNFDFIRKCREKHIAFMGGGTASIVSDKEPVDLSAFATRNADNNKVVPPSNFVATPGCYRASLANPAFRRSVVDWCKIQIDAGVDGIFFDEANGAGFYGCFRIKRKDAPENPNLRYIRYGGIVLYADFNEGFDDYFIADFNRYLINKYPDYTESDWIAKFGMAEDNMIRPDIPYNDLVRNFNYRKYLKTHGWERDPHNTANPLAREWGKPVPNRPSVHDENFMEKYLRLYWKEMVLATRGYARERSGREIWITSNGIFPYVDFNSLGMCGVEEDDSEWRQYDFKKELEYLPLLKGHLNGSKSLKPVYMKVLKRSREVSGDVPLVMFIDFPTPLASRYYQLSKSEKVDYWRIYGAEMYACGLFPAFHLKTVMQDEPSASESGILDFFIEYAKFFRANNDLYHSAVNTGKTVEISQSGIEYNVTFQQKQKRYLIHLINHNYQRKILPQAGFTVSLEMEENPASVTLLTPDGSTSPPLSYRMEGNKLLISVEKIEAYDVLIVEM